MNSKRAKGRYYTLGNPFALRPFRSWAQQASLPLAHVLEPFAGANHIIDSLIQVGLCRRFTSYDISPASSQVYKRDTIASFPTGYSVCVTNPPWLARNSATRRKLAFPVSPYDDLYKHCLALCLAHCRYVAALLPASFLESGLFTERLASYVLLHTTLFADTRNPVCLALFTWQVTARVGIFYDDQYIDTLANLRRHLPCATRELDLSFNDPAGRLGFISFDGTKTPTIRFCHAREISAYSIKASSRFITRISGSFGNVANLIDRLNHNIEVFRIETRDIFLTPFKGLRRDGSYRRRMKFTLARQFINAA